MHAITYVYIIFVFLKEHDQTITKAREEFEKLATGGWLFIVICIELDVKYYVCAAELQSKHELKMQALRDELELRRKTEIHEIEEVDLEHAMSWMDSLYCP